MCCVVWVKFPLGIQAAACVRVGNALGAGDTAGAILTSKVSLALSGQSHTYSSSYGPYFNHHNYGERW